MSDLNVLKGAVFAAIDEFNLSQEVASKLEKREDEILFARAGFTATSKLDSLTLVYFLVTLEEHLQRVFGSDFDLKTQELIDSKEQFLKDVSTLMSYIQNLN